MLVEGLPPNGALARRVAGHPLQYADFRLADLVDQIGMLLTDFRNANRGEKDAPQPYPEKVWRPEKRSAKKKRAKKAARQAAADRSWYQGLVAQVTPEHAEKG
ncbi:hypothetical protein ACH4C6_07640 [Streptomyces sp. NPDC017943]|uniref:hypothetical protein n=1 Tax=Streptomyces sp. NPDC017943 TaxID=3365019 RepID=UPI0037B99F99